RTTRSARSSPSRSARSPPDPSPTGPAFNRPSSPRRRSSRSRSSPCSRAARYARLNTGRSGPRAKARRAPRYPSPRRVGPDPIVARPGPLNRGAPRSWAAPPLLGNVPTSRRAPLQRCAGRTATSTSAEIAGQGRTGTGTPSRRTLRNASPERRAGARRSSDRRRACRLVGDVRYVLLPLRLADAIADRRAEVRRDRLRVGVPDPYRAVGAATGQAARRGESDAVDRLGRGVDGGESDRSPWIRDVPQPQRAVTTA